MTSIDRSDTVEVDADSKQQDGDGKDIVCQTSAAVLLHGHVTDMNVVCLYGVATVGLLGADCSWQWHP